MTTKKRTDIRQLALPLAILLVVGFLANAGVWAMLVRPKAQAYEQMAAGGGEALNSLKRRTANIERLERYVDKLAQADVDMETLRTDVLSSRDQRMVDVNIEVTSLCEQFNIPVAQVNYGTDILEREELDRYDISLPLEGNYSDLRHFLQAVESSDKFLIVQKVALRQQSDGRTRSSQLQLDIDLATYFTASEQLLESWKAMRQGGRR